MHIKKHDLILSQNEMTSDENNASIDLLNRNVDVIKSYCRRRSNFSSSVALLLIFSVNTATCWL